MGEWVLARANCPQLDQARQRVDTATNTPGRWAAGARASTTSPPAAASGLAPRPPSSPAPSPAPSAAGKTGTPSRRCVAPSPSSCHPASQPPHGGKHSYAGKTRSCSEDTQSETSSGGFLTRERMPTYQWFNGANTPLARQPHSRRPPTFPFEMAIFRTLAPKELGTDNTTHFPTAPLKNHPTGRATPLSLNS